MLVFFSFVLLLFFVWLFVIAFFCEVFGLCEQADLFGGIARLSWSRRKKKSWARSGGSAYKVTSEIS